MAAAIDAEGLLFVEEMTTDVDSVQERVLAEILGRNAGTEYLANCGLARAADRATFRAKVPVVTYEDLRPYIRRIADGDRSPILSGRPVPDFLTSSGMSAGERKLIPTAAAELGRIQLLYSLVMAVMNQSVAGLDKGKGLYFLFVKAETQTPGGLAARPGLTRYYKSDHFRRSCHSYTSPAAATLCTDAFQSMYAHMVCGLSRRHDVLRIGAVFASSLLRAVRFLQLNWEQLAADIEAGTLTPRVTDPLVLARFIRAECSKGDWSGIITRIWPNTKFLRAVVTGSMAQYIPALNHYSGGLPIASTIYGSSECYFGLNLRPVCDPSEVSYTIMPNMGYFEFLPVDKDDATDAATATQLVDLAGVETGREYELVVTTYAGLNRYRVGDVLRVTGFHNSAPQFRFLRRRSVLLSVDADKTGEVELQRAVERASALLRPHGAAVADYTSRVCSSTIPGHYVIYWELLVLAADKPRHGGGGGTVVEAKTMEACCLEMEEALNAVYRQCRVADASVRPLEIRVVWPGTFEELTDHAIAGGASISQYKVPLCVTALPVVDLLDSCVISSHFSPASLHWTLARGSA
ncbi:hypothetical protein ACP4OV_011099 [Aristida adscensionis]